MGLTLVDGKRTLAGLQDHLVRAQAEEYCRHRRLCSHCGSQRRLKDVRARRVLSVFGTVEVRAPRFMPCRCAVTRRHILNPIAEIMPDRCTPEYERIIAKMGSLLPYRRARALLSEFLPLADVPAVETTRRRTVRVGARLEKLAVAGQPPVPVDNARAIALSIDGGHVRSVRSYQVRSFEVMLAQVRNDDGKQIVFASMPAEADHQREQLRGHCHVNFCRTAGSHPRMHCADHATCGVHVSCCQMLKVSVRIVRWELAVIRCRRGWKWPWINA